MKNTHGLFALFLPVLFIICGFVSAISIVNAQTAGTITFSPSSLKMYVGENKTVILSGSTSYSLGTNSNPSVASAVLDGSLVKVTAYNLGIDNISICSYINNLVSCGVFGVEVLKQPELQPSSQKATISFSKSEVTVNVGEAQTVTVYGSGAGSYYISGYSSDSVGASINNNIVTLIGSRIGGSNISVCQFGGTCGNIYGYVPSSTANSQAAQAVPAVVPTLSAFYVASNGINGFIGKGATLTLKFNTSDDITSEILKIDGQVVPVTGSGSGPYGGTYTLSGNETIPLPVSMDFSTARGGSGHASFTIGDKANVPAPIVSNVTNPPAAPSSLKFTRNLQSGYTGVDVSSLQGLLKRLGVYDGPITGKFGVLTEAAVKKYQAKNNVKQVGVVGPATRELLNKEQ
ncbi:MAG: peptidoglycan-binding domain-containing protein [Candidatus Taylorbacteria bacterium]|nr:peptidoglycan-binding domain-containing protein [Candidatus Taylorbacteria bacterium]